MRVLEFVVKQQRLMRKVDCDFSHIVAGSAGYLQAKFYFSPEWSNHKKAASFWMDGKESAVLLDENDSCIIPTEVLTEKIFEVSVTGANDNDVVPTTKVKVKQEVH